MNRAEIREAAIAIAAMRTKATTKKHEKKSVGPTHVESALDEIAVSKLEAGEDAEVWE